MESGDKISDSKKIISKMKLNLQHGVKLSNNFQEPFQTMSHYCLLMRVNLHSDKAVCVCGCAYMRVCVCVCWTVSVNMWLSHHCMPCWGVSHKHRDKWGVSGPGAALSPGCVYVTIYSLTASVHKHEWHLFMSHTTLWGQSQRCVQDERRGDLCLN